MIVNVNLGKEIRKDVIIMSRAKKSFCNFFYRANIYHHSLFNTTHNFSIDEKMSFGFSSYLVALNANIKF